MNMPATWYTKARQAKRAPRFETDLHLEAKTFGSSYACDVVAINVSLTGIMISGQAEIVPFQKNTLVELRIDPQGEHFKEPFTCIGKVARLEIIKPDDHSHVIKKIGICITDLNEDNLSPWVNYVNDISRVQPNETGDEDAADMDTILDKSFRTKPVYREGRF